MLRRWIPIFAVLASLMIRPAPGAPLRTLEPCRDSSPPLLDPQSASTTNRLPQVGALPRLRFGEGPLHKIWIRSDDTNTWGELLGRGALVRSYDYGRRTLLIVDERPFGGHLALEQAGYEFSDEQDLVLFNGWILNTRRPEATLSKLGPGERLSDPLDRRLYAGAGLYVVQFEGPVRDEWIDELKAVGAQLVHHVPMNAFVVQARPSVVDALEEMRDSSDHVQFVGIYEPGFRVHPDLRRAVREQRNEPLRVTLQVIDGGGVRAIVDEIALMADEMLEVNKVGRYFNVRALLHPVFFETLSAHPRIFGLEPFGHRVTNDEAQGQIVAGNISGAAPTSPGYLAWLAAMGFNSSQFSSFSVNVVDDATSLTGHPDLASGRIEFALNPTSQGGAQGGHGFLNAHIVAGFNNGSGSTLEDANGFNYGLGIAPWAHVGSTAIFGGGGSSPSSWESSAYSSGARISTNSWGFTSGGAPIPDYDSNSQEYDVLTRDAQSGTGGNQELLVLFAAGNSGSGSNTVSTPGTAKNIITVGASENWRQTGTDGCAVGNSGANDLRDIIGFSSRGPVNSGGGDGRWKPEIVAPGTHVQAGVPQSNYNGSSVCNAFWPSGSTLYGWSSGTSHSTPALAGGAALVYQDFLNDGLSAPSPAMAKAVLTNSSEYMTGVGANDTLPSNSQGMGLMDLGRAFDSEARILVDQTVVLSASGASHSVSGNVNNTGAPFRVTLVWTDVPGSTTGAPWVNDLNLEVSVGGSTFLGNVFSGANSTTGGSADIRNNTESVFLPAGTSGSFTVTVDAASIAGDGVPGNGDSTDQDFALVIYNGASGPVPPTANFSGTPTTGLAPLTVAFTDASSVSATSFSWSFGDGGTSTLENPTHTYSAVGSYTVSLTVNDAIGSDTESKTNYIQVIPPPTPGISDGSFESQTAGTTPTTPWTVDFGTGHLVNPAGTASDSGMPTHGTNWVEVDAESANNASGPSNPGGAGTPPSGGAGISQSFFYAGGQSELSFDAAFLRNEAANSSFNDWMSVDITDGATWANLYYADTFTATPNTSARHGFPMTAISPVTVELTTLFPGSTTATQFTVTVQVGNAVDSIQPSIGYADNFVLTGAVPAPVAGFSATPTSGVEPLTVSFTDSSTGSITSRSWAFGDGGTSSATNPSHVYGAAGTYTATLTVTGPGGSDSASTTITVNDAPPVASFNASPTSGVAPLTVNFTDTSSGNVTSRSWIFGDGGASSATNPSHVYSTPGTYVASLSVTGPGGSDSASTSITVVEPAPVAGFSASPTSGTAPLTVSFTDGSSGNITSRSWTFGDGGTSTATNPSHVYGTPGTYTAALTVTGPGGSDSASTIITVTEPAPVAGLNATPTTGTAPLTVSFSDASSGTVTSYSWTFGDGGSSSAMNASHTYATSGIYTATLTVTGPGGSDSASTTITVNAAAPVAGFGASPTSGDVPLSVSFSDASTGEITSHAWAFGDGGTSNLQSPGHTYTTPGTYTATLTVSGPGGSDSASTTITVTEPAPTAAFSGSPTSGTVPLTVGFTDASSGNITSRSWTFGDGGTSSQTNPSHVYSAIGTYTVSLSVSGPGGSDTSTLVDYITVSAISPPAADFTGTPTSGIAPLTVAFSDATSGNVSGWSWTFGDGGTSTAQNPSHTYGSSGTYTVSLTATGPGGSNTRTRTDYVTVTPPAPTAAFSASPTSGTAPLTVAFTDASSGAITSHAWAFGDGGTSSLQNPGHTYASAGSYTATLTVTGPGGSDSAATTITVNAPAPVAAFSASPTTGTAPLTVSFTDLSTGSPTAWSWSFGDGGTSIAQNPSFTYTAAGTYTVSLTVTGPGGTDTATQVGAITVAAPAPVADFSATPLSGAAPLSVNFTDLSSGAVSLWSWTFGDGGTSSLQNPSHTYASDGTYTVSLSVTGPGGSSIETKLDLISVNSAGDPIWYVSFTTNTSVPGVGTVADEDVVSYDPVTGTWAHYFDGSDVGMGGSDINALHVRGDGSILMSFNQASSVSGLSGGPDGTIVDDSDVVLFTFTGAPGSNTAGTFTFHLDGSDVGLTTNGEDIDGLHEFANGDLAVSSTGRMIATGVDVRDEDVSTFSGTGGAATSGSFTPLFDGSDVGFAGSGADDIDSVSFSAGGEFLFSTVGTYIGASSTGADEDISRFTGTLGAATSGTASLELVLGALGIAAGEDVDGMSFGLQ